MKNTFLFLILSCSIFCYSQNPFFKQSNYQITSANPAYACNTDCLAVNLHYLNDWPELGSAFSTTRIGANVRVGKRWNISLNYERDNLGELQNNNIVLFTFGKKFVLNNFYFQLGLTSQYINKTHLISNESLFLGEIMPNTSISNLNFNGGISLGYKSVKLREHDLNYYNIQTSCGILNLIEPDFASIAPGTSPFNEVLTFSIELSKTFEIDKQIINSRTYFFSAMGAIDNYTTIGTETTLILPKHTIQSFAVDLNYVNDGGIGIGIEIATFNFKVKFSNGVPLFSNPGFLTNEYYQLSVMYQL